MYIMTIVAKGYKFEKAISQNVAYVFDEFGEQVLDFVSYAKDFYEFNEDVTTIIKGFYLENKTTNGYYDDSYVMEKLV